VAPKLASDLQRVGWAWNVHQEGPQRQEAKGNEMTTTQDPEALAVAVAALEEIRSSAEAECEGRCYVKTYGRHSPDCPHDYAEIAKEALVAVRAGKERGA